MTESIADRYRRRAQRFTDVVEAVPADRWESPSPCEEWTARDIVRHVSNSQGMFAGFIDRELEPGPSVDDDPLGAWIAARDQTQAALDDPEVATTEYDGFLGKSTFEAGVDRFIAYDLVIHAWDLARAAGLDDTIPPEDVEALQAATKAMDEQMGSAMRGPGAFGPELTPPDDADPQTKLLAFIGRQAW